MRKKADQALEGETRKQDPKEVESERPEQRDKEHGEEVDAPKKKSKVAERRKQASNTASSFAMFAQT